MGTHRWLSGLVAAIALFGAGCVPPPEPPPPGAPTVVDPPMISGTPVVGSILTSSAGTWLGNPTGFTSTWQTCDAATGGECVEVSSGSSYELVEADNGRWVQVTVVAQNAAGEGQATSERVGPVTGDDPASPVEIVETPTQTVTITGPPGSTLEVESAEAAALPPLPLGAAFPVGAFGITVSDVVPGSVVTVEIQLEYPVDSVAKLIDGDWSEFDDDGTTGAVLSPDGTLITLRLADGGRGDSDGIADGTIIDPVAPAIGLETCFPFPVTDWDDPELGAGISQFSYELAGPIDSVENLQFHRSFALGVVEDPFLLPPPCTTPSFPFRLTLVFGDYPGSGAFGSLEESVAAYSAARDQAFDKCTTLIPESTDVTPFLWGPPPDEGALVTPSGDTWVGLFACIFPIPDLEI